MKKASLALILLLILGAAFSSCSEDPIDEIEIEDTNSGDGGYPWRGKEVPDRPSGG